MLVCARAKYHVDCKCARMCRIFVSNAHSCTRLDSSCRHIPLYVVIYVLDRIGAFTHFSICWHWSARLYVARQLSCNLAGLGLFMGSICWAGSTWGWVGFLFCALCMEIILLRIRRILVTLQKYYLTTVVLNTDDNDLIIFGEPYVQCTHMLSKI